MKVDVCAGHIIWYWEVVRLRLREGTTKRTREKTTRIMMMTVRKSGFPLSWATCVESMTLLEAAKSRAMLDFCTCSCTRRVFIIIVYHGLAVR